MPEEVLFEIERRDTRESIAEVFRQVAQSLSAGDPITFTEGDQSVQIDPPGRPTFEVKIEREGPVDGPGELSLELEVEWPEDATENGELRIE